MTLQRRVVARYLLGSKATPEQVALVHKLLAKYAHMLGVHELPRVAIKDNLGSKWLGQLVWRSGQQNIMNLQRSVLADERTLERIVAHEMAHHVEALEEYNDKTLALLRVGIKPKEHGDKFLELAHKINNIVGANFVTVTSDKSYVEDSQTKPYFILVEKISRGFGYAYGVRITPKMQRFIDRHLADGARLIKTTDPRWAHGVRIGEGGLSAPVDSEAQTKLKALYEQP